MMTPEQIAAMRADIRCHIDRLNRSHDVEEELARKDGVIVALWRLTYDVEATIIAQAAEIERLRANPSGNRLSEVLASFEEFLNALSAQRDRMNYSALIWIAETYYNLAEGMGPTELFGLLNLYFKQIIHIVQEHGGTIDKFVGDCVMVLFGAPVDAGDQEWRAVRCAVEIQRVIAELNASRPGQATLQMGIGINTGEAMTGCLGSAERMDYTALGDTVNTAARLESRAQGGQVLVGPATAEAVRGRIDCVSVGPLQLKGKMEAIEAFEVR